MFPIKRSRSFTRTRNMLDMYYNFRAKSNKSKAVVFTSPGVVEVKEVESFDPGADDVVIDVGGQEYTLEPGETLDITPPEITSISASPSVLWPPNHKMVKVTVEVDATDNSGSAPFCCILGVSSNESINGPGDGDTEPDWDYADDPLVVLLRAERAGGGDGRVYTIEVGSTDASGNAATDTVEVIVPHDQGKGKK